MKYTKSDQQVLEFALAGATVAAGLIAVVNLVQSMTAGAVESQVWLEDSTALASDARFELNVSEGTAVINDPVWWERLLTVAPTVVGALTIAAVAWKLFLVARSLGAGDPFLVSNVHRLTTAGIIALVGGFAAAGAQAIGQWVFSARLPEDFGVEITGYLDGTPLIAGLALVAVAQIIRRGTVLRHELDGVI